MLDARREPRSVVRRGAHKLLRVVSELERRAHMLAFEVKYDATQARVEVETHSYSGS